MTGKKTAGANARTVSVGQPVILKQSNRVLLVLTVSSTPVVLRSTRYIVSSYICSKAQFLVITE